MTKMDCSTCRSCLPDLLLERQPVQATTTAHLAGCAECRREFEELQATMAVMDAWVAPEPSPYFDARLRAKLREAQASAPEGLWERLTSYLLFSTGRGLRPAAAAGVLALVMALGGGTAVTVLLHHQAAATSSPTVNDLRIYDNNAQAVQQMDLLDEAGSADDAPQT